MSGNLLGWQKRLAAMRETVSAAIFAALMKGSVPLYLVYLPVAPDPRNPARNLWGELGFANGLIELERLQAEGWRLADPKAMRGTLSRRQVELFVAYATGNAEIIGDD